MSAELLDLSGAAAAAAIRAGEVDARELFELYRSRAAADELNAFTWLAETAPSERVPADAPLAGVPLAVKDLFCTKGIPSQAGSKILEGYRPPYTATVVRQLIEAGAPLLGKTNQDEFAMGSSNENSAFGPVLNPWDTRRVPGGSSGGSAAAVAAGLAPWALGTDTGGSIRQPAAFSGIVGLKPTYGACSRHGMIAFASSLDQAGPLTRDVTDSALLLRHMVGQDPYDSTSLAFPEAISLPSREDLKGVRLGVPEELLGPESGIEPGVRASFDAALAEAEKLGASVLPCRLPLAPHALSAYYIIAPAEASSNLARFDGVRYGLRVAGDVDLTTMYTTNARRGFRSRGQAPDHARHVRAVKRLLRRVLRHRPACAHAHRRGFPRRLRGCRLHRDADGAWYGVRARREDSRPAGHVPERLLHGADVACRNPRDFDPVRVERRPAGGAAAGGSGVQ